MTAAAAAAASHSAKPLKFQTPRQPSTGSVAAAGRTPLLQRTYVDHLTGETSVTSSLESETAFYTTTAPVVQQNTSSTQTMVSMPTGCDEIVGRTPSGRPS